MYTFKVSKKPNVLNLQFKFFPPPPRFVSARPCSKMYLNNPCLHLLERTEVTLHHRTPIRSCMISESLSSRAVRVSAGSLYLLCARHACKDGNARFITVHLKVHLSYQVCIWYLCLCFFKLLIFIWDFSAKVTCTFIIFRKQMRNYQK